MLDLILPAFDGWSLCEALRADRDLAAVPVVVCSAAPSYLQDALRRSMTVAAFHPKPVDVGALAATLRRLCA